jgi:hypothetical protein
MALRNHKKQACPESSFREVWLERFGLTDWPVDISTSPFLGKSVISDSIEFLFADLPAFIEKHPSTTYRNTANAYGWACLALTQAMSPFPHPLQDCTMRMRAALKGDLDLFLPDILALSELIVSHYQDGECGLNRLLMDDDPAVRAHESTVATGRFEEYLTSAGLEKFNEFQAYLNESPSFAREWNDIRNLFGNPVARWPELTIGGKLRRPLLNERNWVQEPWWSFDSARGQFLVVFAVFCWKWYLWAMQGDRPLLLKPSISLTPYGTQIFVPGYMSLDAKRDLDFGKISSLHKARGVQRQGPGRQKVRDVADVARLHGTNAIEAVRSAFPEIDERQVRRWLK